MKILIMHRNDNEFYKGLTDSQKRKVCIQVKHVLKSLVNLETCYNKLKDMTWRQFCEKTAKDLLSEVNVRTIEFWHKSYKNNNHVFSVSNQGSFSMMHDLNLFLEMNYP